MPFQTSGDYRGPLQAVQRLTHGDEHRQRKGTPPQQGQVHGGREVSSGLYIILFIFLKNQIFKGEKLLHSFFALGSVF